MQQKKGAHNTPLPKIHGSSQHRICRGGESADKDVKLPSSPPCHYHLPMMGWSSPVSFQRKFCV